MGRTIPTYREKLNDWEGGYTDYYRALRHERQLAFDDLVKHVNRHSMAGNARNHHTPELACLVSICVGQQHEIRELREEVEAHRREPIVATLPLQLLLCLIRRYQSV